MAVSVVAACPSRTARCATPATSWRSRGRGRIGWMGADSCAAFAVSAPALRKETGNYVSYGDLQPPRKAGEDPDGSFKPAPFPGAARYRRQRVKPSTRQL